MDIIYYIFNKFITEEWKNIIMLIITCFIINILQTNGISVITANIIDSLKNMNQIGAMQNYYYFIIISVFYLIFYYFYKIFQTETMTKLRQWTRYQLVRLFLIVNNQNLSQMNFTKLNSPINRISSTCFMIFNDVLTFFLPNIILLFVITGFFFYKDWKLGLSFLIGNLILVSYIAFNWKDMLDDNNLYETKVSENEAYLLDVLNNVDTIIHRGQVKKEMEEYSNKINETIDVARSSYSNTNNHNMVMNIILYIILFLTIGYLLFSFFNKTMDLTLFITCFTILAMYREKMFVAIQGVSDVVEFIGRAESVTIHFKDTAKDYMEIEKKEIAPLDLPFDVIQFENVSFKYKKGENMVLENANIMLHTDNKIIGIMGLSGGGKSTLVKLAIKLYRPDSGKIYIDGHDIEFIDADYIRENITYVNQTSKLFDKQILENIMYGCKDPEMCKEHLKYILQFDKIKELFSNMDIEKTMAGSLGEGLSGGQRQVVNIIGGLINPSKILILDEPTNSLDGELKKEILKIIQHFKQHKKCIIIITHDKDVEPILTDVLTL